MRCLILLLVFQWCVFAGAQTPLGTIARPSADTSARYIYDVGKLAPGDTLPLVNLREVQIVTFKSAEEWSQYYAYKARIEKVMPYVKIAKELYTELQEKEENSKKRDYRHYRKDVEKEMRGRFEKELKDLTTTQGEMLFKLINRETGNNCYTLIKEVKNPFTAWVCQVMAKRWGYDLKDTYDPKKEKMIELIIRQLGPNYKI